MALKPAIKWSGSKRSQASEIISHFPKEIDTYYEPFCGGCSVLGELLCSNINVNKYVCSDINEDLINLWNEIKRNPDRVADYYEKLWLEMNDDNNDKAFKKNYFETVRERYNNEHNPLDFMFIMRTTTNGMPRYNKQGKFNNSFHISRNGIVPETLRGILNEWCDLLTKNDVNFICCSFENIQPSQNDFLYLDPPYAGTKGMYFGGFDNEMLFNWLKNINCKWIMSYDGISGDIDNTYQIPKELYDEHLYIKSGNSSFKRVIGKSTDSIVYESLYLNHNNKNEQ